MKVYTKDTVKEINKAGKEFYLPSELFDSNKYKDLRLETKFAYCALVDVMNAKPLFDHDGNAYIKTTNPVIQETLAKLANKNVDQEKVDKYLKELNQNNLIVVEKQNIYITPLND